MRPARAERGGCASITGSEEEPAKVGISVADISAGMYAFSSVLAALLRREKTGEGSSVEVSLFDSLAEWMSYPIYYSYGGARRRATARDTRSSRHTDRTPLAMGRSSTSGFRTSGNGRGSAQRCSGEPEMATDPRFSSNTRRVEHRDELDAVITARVQRSDDRQTSLRGSSRRRLRTRG